MDCLTATGGYKCFNNMIGPKLVLPCFKYTNTEGSYAYSHPRPRHGLGSLYPYDKSIALSTRELYVLGACLTSGGGCSSRELYAAIRILNGRCFQSLDVYQISSRNVSNRSLSSTQLISADSTGDIEISSISAEIWGRKGAVSNVPHATIRPVLLSNTPYRSAYRSFSLLV